MGPTFRNALMDGQCPERAGWSWAGFSIHIKGRKMKVSGPIGQFYLQNQTFARRKTIYIRIKTSPASPLLLLSACGMRTPISLTS